MGFRVIIAGGSVSGLTLANALEKFNIDYILLEAYPSIAPQVGASIGILPNGFRILDQLGCFEPVRDISNEFYLKSSINGPDGKPRSQSSTASIHHLEKRFVRLYSQSNSPCADIVIVLVILPFLSTGKCCFKSCTTTCCTRTEFLPRRESLKLILSTEAFKFAPKMVTFLRVI